MVLCVLGVSSLRGCFEQGISQRNIRHHDSFFEFHPLSDSPWIPLGLFAQNDQWRELLDAAGSVFLAKSVTEPMHRQDLALLIGFTFGWAPNLELPKHLGHSREKFDDSSSQRL